MITSIFKIPTELDFLEAFGIEPEVSEPSDGFWSYRFEDTNGLSVVVSFNQFEESLQTALFQGDQEITTVSHEGAQSLKIVEMKSQKPKLLGTCDCRGETIKLVVELDPHLYVNWSSIRNT